MEGTVSGHEQQANVGMHSRLAKRDAPAGFNIFQTWTHDAESPDEGLFRAYCLHCGGKGAFSALSKARSWCGNHDHYTSTEQLAVIHCKLSS